MKPERIALTLLAVALVGYGFWMMFFGYTAPLTTPASGR
jgi:hypothetical protein